MVIEPLLPYLIDSPLHVGFAWHFVEKPGFQVARYLPMKAPVTADKPLLLVSTFAYKRVRTFQGDAPVASIIRWLVTIGEALFDQNLIYGFGVVPLDPLEPPKISGEFEDLMTKQLAAYGNLATAEMDVTEFDNVGDITHEHESEH
jgi:hypothetical protein